jgi:hypothetical protein
MIRKPNVVGVGLLVILCPPGVKTQEVTMLRESPDLETAQVERIEVFGDEDEGTVGPNFVFDVTPAGQFLVSPFSRNSEILVFDSTGAFQLVVGRNGDGPGEYRSIRHIKMGAALVHVFDNSLRRWTALNPKDWSVVGTTPLPTDPHDVQPMGDTAVFSAGMVLTREKIGIPVHRVNSHGEIDLSFGEEEGTPFRADMSILARRVLAEAGPGAIWVSHVTRYRLERWSVDGELLEVLERETPWFEAHAVESIPDPEIPPKPIMVDILFDEESSLLWTASVVADEQWAEGVERSVYHEGRGYEVKDWNKYQDTILEAIDVASGLVVGRIRLDEFIWSLGSGRTAASYFEDQGVFPKIALWQFGMNAGS